MKQRLQFCPGRLLLSLCLPLFLLSGAASQATKKPPATAPKTVAKAPAAPAAHPAGTAAGAHGSTTASHTTTTTTTANHAGATTTSTARTTTTTEHTGAAGAHGGVPTTRAAAGGHPEEIAHRGPMAGHPAPANSHEFHGEHGDVRMRANGRPMDVHDARRGMDIHHNLYGGRRVLVDRPGGGRMYYERGRPGYIGHPYRAHGYDFNRRTYYYQGRAYDRYYRPYGYHGYMLDVYVPGRYYPAAFYGWAYNPWGAPVAYSWGFGPQPWYGFYGAYFTPYPVYATPALWLTDYLISQQLAAAYTAQQEAGIQAAALSGQPLAPDVKQMISTEVQRDIALENTEAQANSAQQAPDPASSGIARLMSDGQPHVFVASREVDVTDAGGRECAVTDGDVVLVRTPPGAADTTATATVLSTKSATDCAQQTQVQIGLDELNEMNNHLRETVDQGLQELQAKQGTGGLPAAPPSAKAPGVDALVAQGAPPPDPAGAKELEQQAQVADTSEKEVVAEAGSAAGGAPVSTPAASAAPVQTQTVSLAIGQTGDQVKAAMGNPTRIVNVGSKSIYFYDGTKVTLIDGKVKTIE